MGRLAAEHFARQTKTTPAKARVDPWIVAAVLVGTLDVVMWVVGLRAGMTLPAFGMDLHTYQEAARSFVAGTGFYHPYQLAGPYGLDGQPILYPPAALPLFLVFGVLPDFVWWAFLWWAIPLGVLLRQAIRQRETQQRDDGPLPESATRALALGPAEPVRDLIEQGLPVARRVPVEDGAPVLGTVGVPRPAVKHGQAALAFLRQLVLPRPVAVGVEPVAFRRNHVAHPRILLALALLAWPQTVTLLWAGNPVMWMAAALALGYSPLVLLKPTMAPFALFGIRDRKWWIGLGVLLTLTVATLPLLPDYMTVLANVRADNLWYQLGSVPIMVVGWICLGLRQSVDPDRA